MAAGALDPGRHGEWRRYGMERISLFLLYSQIMRITVIEITNVA